MDQVISQIIDIASELYNKLTALLSDYLLLTAGLGLCILLILILLITRRKRSRQSGGSDGDIEFLEVGPEPVIVYRRSEQATAAEPPANNQSDQAPPPPQGNEALTETAVESVTKIAETQEELTLPDRELPELPIKPAPDQGLLIDRPLPDLPEIPVIQPVLDPEPIPDGEPSPSPQASPPRQVLQLPDLQSELAHSTLNLFTKKGFTIEEIVYQGIYGADFIASRPGIRVYIQVKALNKKLTNTAISEVNSYAMNHECASSVIVSAAKFNRRAVKAASRLNVYLWNKKSLKKYQEQPIFPHLDEAAASK